VRGVDLIKLIETPIIHCGVRGTHCAWKDSISINGSFLLRIARVFETYSRRGLMKGLSAMDWNI